MHCCSGKSALKETVSKQRASKRKYSPVSASTKHVQSAHQDVQGTERFTSLDAFVHLYLTQITLLIHSKNMSLNHYLNHRNEDSLCLCNLSPAQRAAELLQPPHWLPRQAPCGVVSPPLYQKPDIISTWKFWACFLKTSLGPNSFTIHSSCKFLPCSCPVRCIINCLHPLSHPSRTTLQQDCQIRFIAIQL